MLGPEATLKKELKKYKKLKATHDKLDKELSTGKISNKALKKLTLLQEELEKMGKKFKLEKGNLVLNTPSNATTAATPQETIQNKDDFLKSYKNKMQDKDDAFNDKQKTEEIEYMERMNQQYEEEVYKQAQLKDAQISQQRNLELKARQEQQYQAQQIQAEQMQAQQQSQQHQALQQQAQQDAYRAELAQRQHALQQQAYETEVARQVQEQAIDEQTMQQVAAEQQLYAIRQEQKHAVQQGQAPYRDERAEELEQQIRQQQAQVEQPQQQRALSKVTALLPDGIELPIMMSPQDIAEFMVEIHKSMKTNEFFNINGLLVNPNQILTIHIEEPQNI